MRLKFRSYIQTNVDELARTSLHLALKISIPPVVYKRPLHRLFDTNFGVHVRNRWRPFYRQKRIHRTVQHRAKKNLSANGCCITKIKFGRRPQSDHKAATARPTIGGKPPVQQWAGNCQMHEAGNRQTSNRRETARPTIGGQPPDQQ